MEIIKCKSIYEYAEVIKSKDLMLPIIVDIYAQKFADVLVKEGVKVKFKDYKDLSLNPLGYESNLQEMIQENNKISSTRSIIVSLNKDDWFWPAYLHAKLTKSSLFVIESYDEIESIIARLKPEYITLCGNPSKMDVSLTIKMLELQLKAYQTFHAFYFGFLTSRNLNTFSCYIIKNHLLKKNTLSNKSIILDRREFTQEETLIENNTYIIPFKTSNTQNLLDVANNNSIDVFSSIGHGRDSLIWMNDGLICGKNSLHETVDSEFLPSCAQCDRCIKDSIEIMSIEKINAKHFFINSCFSLKTDKSIFGLGYCLSHTIIENSGISIIGSNNIVDGQSFSNYLYFALISEGYSLGETALLINKSFVDYGIGTSFSYYLLGDPTIKIKASKNCNTYEMPNLEKGRLKLKYFIEDSYLLILDLCDHVDINSFKTGRIRIYAKTDKDDTVFGIFALHNNRKQLILYSTRKFKNTTLFLSLHPSSPFHFNEIREFDKFMLLKVTGDKNIKNSTNYISETGINLSKSLRKSLYELSQTSKFYAKYDRYKEKVSRLQKDILNTIIDKTHFKGFSFSEHCVDNGLHLESYNISKKCGICSYETIEYTYRHPIYHDFSICCIRCPVCGELIDKASGLDVNMEFVGDTVFKATENVIQSLTIQNISESAIYSGFAAVSIVSGNGYQVSYQNRYLEFQLNPQETICHDFSIEFPSNPTPHIYWLRGTLVANGSIMNIKKNVFLRI
ncbi:MAG: hypothetical protein N2645_00240 [Clostridia bacterium]|nr:hypothetical protein [Clostridia bacterium]